MGWWWRERITGIGIGPIRLEERHLARVDRWFSKHGEGTGTAVSNAPGRPGYISYPAGTAKMPPARFGLFTLVGTTPFTLGLIYGGMLLGSHWNQIEQEFSLLDYVLVAVLAVGVAYFFVVLFRRSRALPPDSAGPPPAGSSLTPPPPTPPSAPRPGRERSARPLGICGGGRSELRPGRSVPTAFPAYCSVGDDPLAPQVDLPGEDRLRHPGKAVHPPEGACRWAA